MQHCDPTLGRPPKRARQLLQGQEAANARHILWRRLRGPFVLPCALQGHNCYSHWEQYDSDQAGCLLCGAPHWCGARMCTELLSECAHVCSITGMCLRPRMLCEFGIDQAEHFVETSQKLFYKNNDDRHAAVRETEKKLKEKCVRRRFQRGQKAAAVTPTVASTVAATVAPTTQKLGGKVSRNASRNVLSDVKKRPTGARVLAKCMSYSDVHLSVRIHIQNFFASQAINAALKHDHGKLVQQLRGALSNEIRGYMREKRSLNWVCVEGALHASLQSQRLPQRQSRLLDNALQQRVITAIVTLLMFMMQHCSGVNVNLRQPDFVLGLLYLLRCGVRVFDVVVLPQIAQLVHVLPSEQHLQPSLGVRAKVVSEAENCVKHQLRKLPTSLVAQLAREN
jgi:hypothetical protein